jgi:membrane protease YdiL (CAAX protease family)
VIDRTPQRNVAEVALVFVVIGTYLWFGRRSFPGANLAFAAVLLAILMHAHRQAGEDLREIGFRRDTFAATSRLLLPVVLIGGALIVTAGMALGEMHFPSWATGVHRVAQFVALGIAQQYVLLGFVFGRVERIAGARFAPELTALLFALLHLPNGWLTAVTFIWGVVACLIYRRSPNLWANGLAHGVLAALVYYALPRSVTNGLRVGIDYFAGL